MADTSRAHLLTQMELAERWGISHRTLERWRWEKKGPRYVRVIGQVRYRLADVLAFEAASLVETN